MRKLDQLSGLGTWPTSASAGPLQETSTQEHNPHTSFSAPTLRLSDQCPESSQMGQARAQTFSCHVHIYDIYDVKGGSVQTARSHLCINLCLPLDFVRASHARNSPDSIAKRSPPTFRGTRLQRATRSRQSRQPFYVKWIRGSLLPRPTLECLGHVTACESCNAVGAWHCMARRCRSDAYTPSQDLSEERLLIVYCKQFSN